MTLAITGLLLRCPVCKVGICDANESDVTCPSCGKLFARLKSGGIAFIDVDENIVKDDIDKIKFFGKRFGSLYSILIDVVSPVFPQPTFERRRFLKSVSGCGAVVVNLGSGSSNFGPDVVNFDILPYGSVNVVCSIDNIPLTDNSVDAIVNIAVLEHVPNPREVIAKFLRVLKPGGELYCFIPFIQGFHASPWDFQRFTKPGMEVQFKDFEIEWIHVVGPTSGMLWVLQEWIALVLSFGSKRLHTIIWLLVMGLTWPLKFMDAILKFHPRAENIASGFSIRARKSL